MLNKINLFQSLLLGHKDPKHISPTSRCRLLSSACSRPPAGQGIFPSSAEEGLIASEKSKARLRSHAED